MPKKDKTLLTIPLIEEDQFSVNNWMNQTFGPGDKDRWTRIRSAYNRMSEEFDELAEAVEAEDDIGIMKEAADVMINLYRFAAFAGFILKDRVNQKMQINKHRKWEPDGKGNGHHVKQPFKMDKGQPGWKPLKLREDV